MFLHSVYTGVYPGGGAGVPNLKRKNHKKGKFGVNFGLNLLLQIIKFDESRGPQNVSVSAFATF